MDKVTVPVADLGTLCSLSPEHWLSNSSAEIFAAGLPLQNIIRVGKSGTMSIGKEALVLDTGNADRGLFILPDMLGLHKQTRVSHKKIVPEGSVLISRLRPYLRQVVYVPFGLYELLNVDTVLCSTEFYVLNGINQHNNESIAFLVPWLLSAPIQHVFDQATTGGHHPRFSDDLLMKLSIPEEVYTKRKETSKLVSDITISHILAQIQMRNLT